MSGSFRSERPGAIYLPMYGDGSFILVAADVHSCRVCAVREHTAVYPPVVDSVGRSAVVDTLVTGSTTAVNSLLA